MNWGGGAGVSYDVCHNVLHSGIIVWKSYIKIGRSHFGIISVVSKNYRVPLNYNHANMGPGGIVVIV